MVDTDGAYVLVVDGGEAQRTRPLPLPVVAQNGDKPTQTAFRY